MPSELRPAPSPTATPLPDSFTLTEDASTWEFDSGTVLLGGSPLRLFRISERAGRLVERWRSGHTVGPGRGSQLLALDWSRRERSSLRLRAEPSETTT